MKTTPKTIPAGEFKAKCLHLMDEVNDLHKTVIITKHGKPVAKLVPFDDEPKSLFGALEGSIKINGDIVESLGEQWEADNG